MGFWGISWTICKQSAPRCRQITIPTPHHSIFRMLFLTPNQHCHSRTLIGSHTLSVKRDYRRTALMTGCALDTYSLRQSIWRRC